VRVAAVLTAAGSGTRLGSGSPKALVALRGRPLVAHAAHRLAAVVDELVVTCPAGRLGEMTAAIRPVAPGARLVAGGGTRQASVAAALGLLTADVVLVHDAARPLAGTALARRVLDELARGAQAVVPGLPVVDTIKRVVGGLVVATPDRRALVAVQTPQGFTRDVLTEAHRLGADLAASEVTAVGDDAGLVERFVGAPVTVVPGEERAVKITTRRDLALAEAMLESGEWV
jgi:2-C-methyl-D-erythritol 4-phosphate cytidylyltransferase